MSKKWLPDQETILEAGIISFALLLSGGVATLLFGRVVGAVVRGGRRREGPPQAGSVPPYRHGNVSAPAPR